LSVYESAPDKFDFSQSWGWKSSTLMLEEEFSSPTSTSSGGQGNSPRPDGPAADDDGRGTDAPSELGQGLESGSVAAEVMERERERRREKSRRYGALRFMIVIGNL
jgi:hypothetical protein